MDIQEKQWLDEYRAGDINALGKLVEHYRRPLYGFINKMMENSSEADEVFQEVWFRAVKNLHRFEDGKFLSWMFRITHNLIIDRARKKKPDFSLEAQREDDLTLGEKIEAPGLGPATMTMGHDLGDKIQAAVSRLPAEQREVFLMRTQGDMPFKEIAKIQDISINTALARMQYAMAKLRQDLMEEYKELTEEVV